jgi:hypothetical protein
LAEELQIPGAGSTAKIRHPLGVIGLTLITLGIYFFFWWYFINREMKDVGQARGVDIGDSPGKSVLAVTLGALIIIPALVSEWTTSGRIQKTQETLGVERPASGPVIFILLLLISPVGLWYAQSELNKAWRKVQEGGAGPAAITPPESQPAPPPAERPEVPGQ